MNTSLLRLFQLVSPSLPVGAYAYSQGLEYAVEKKWVNNELDTLDWVMGMLNHNLANLDVPLLKRLHSSWSDADIAQVRYWNSYLLASREAKELQLEDQHLGNALLRLLAQLDVEHAKYGAEIKPVSFATMFAMAAVAWKIPLRDAVMGYVWSWLENQVAAAIKIVPLGQTAGQRILNHGVGVIPEVVDKGLALEDEVIGFMAPSMVMGCAEHEVQYSRLFQS